MSEKIMTPERLKEIEAKVLRNKKIDGGCEEDDMILALLPDAKRMAWLETCETFCELFRGFDPDSKQVVFGCCNADKSHTDLTPTVAEAIDAAMKGECRAMKKGDKQ